MEPEEEEEVVQEADVGDRYDLMFSHGPWSFKTFEVYLYVGWTAVHFFGLLVAIFIVPLSFQTSTILTVIISPYFSSVVRSNHLVNTEGNVGQLAEVSVKIFTRHLQLQQMQQSPGKATARCEGDSLVNL